MDGHRQIKLWLKEAGIYLQFLNEDIDSIESIRENTVSQIEQLLKEATKKLRKSVNLLKIEIKKERNRKSAQKDQIRGGQSSKISRSYR